MGKGGYAIRINKRHVLDCFECRKVQECWASFANSASDLLVDTRPDLPYQNRNMNNAQLVVRGTRVYFKSLKNAILPGQEIL